MTHLRLIDSRDLDPLILVDLTLASLSMTVIARNARNMPTDELLTEIADLVARLAKIERGIVADRRSR